MGQNPRYVLDISQIHQVEKDLVGKKAYEFGALSELGIPLPRGFVITTEFFKKFLHSTGIDKDIKKVETLSHPAITDSIEKLYFPIQEQFMKTHIPEELAFELHKFYRELSGSFRDSFLSVCSSSSNNKSIEFNNVKGDSNLILKIKTIWSLSLRKSVAIVVQENIKPKIMGKIISNNPDVDKKLSQFHKDKLINYCKIIQKYFYFPYEIEYVIRKEKILITKVTPFTGVVSERAKPEIKIKIKQRNLIKGNPINPGLVTGSVKVLNNKYGNIEIKKGEIVVLPNLDRSIFGKIKNAKAVITDSILVNSFDKALFRKTYHMPTVEGIKNATKIFKNGSVVTVNGISGEIYPGGLIY